MNVNTAANNCYSGKINMIKFTKKAALLLLALVLIIGSLAACGGGKTPDPDKTETVHVDYVSELKFNMASTTKKAEVTVKNFVDGDTTHFYISDPAFPGGVLKARYIAINTPESTGKIEEYGKKASNFTKEKLSTATSIYVESDDENWNADSTGSRYVVWVWYKGPGDTEYRNLNLEILQNGYAIASSTANNRYGSTCMNALNQAKAEKLNVFSGEKDDEFYYGDAVELSLVELRTNIEEYNGVKVAFEGVVTRGYNDGVYVEELDPDTGLYFGMYIYNGKTASGYVLDIMSIGNRVRVVGTVSEYNGTYQVSGLQYRPIKPDDPSNSQKISEGHSPAYAKINPNDFASGKVDVSIADETKKFDYAYLILNSSVSMDNLTVTSIYTTDNEDSSSNGAMTLTCNAGGVTIKVRTVVLYDENGNLVTAAAYAGKTISVRGIVDCFNGEYQIKVLSYKDITIN